MANEFVPMYDLEALTEPQRAEYVKRVCKHMGVPDDLNLVMLTYLDEQDGPRRLVAYAKRGATEIIRDTRGISIVEMTSKEVGGSIVYTVTGINGSGRREMSTGSKYIAGLTGQALDDAIMTAQTRATRRMTLQFVGAGVLDESEVNPRQTTNAKNTTAITPAAQPTAAPVSAPGNDITMTTPSLTAPVAELKKEDYIPGLVVPTEEQMATFNEQQKKLREDAIAQLNAKAEVKVKRTRKSKTTVDLGPSSNPVPAAVTQAAAVAPELPPSPPAAPAQPVQEIPPPAPAPTVAGKPKLSPEQIKPYRQRQFKLITDLEMAGFAPKEGTGNLDKMRSYVGLMFPEVTNFNELTVEQWEKYLTTVENKVKAEGAAATIKYIEDAIGI